jgi:Bacterial archaeo-eukaryotic release factor family 2
MELSFLRDLYDTPGPWASVYLDASHNTEDAGATLKIRWKDLRESLHGQGIDNPTLRALENELIDDRTLRALDGTEVEEAPHPGRHGLAMFAAAGEVRHAELLSVPPSADSAQFEPLPHLTPLLIDRGEHITWLRVIVDRVGADVQDPAHEIIKAEGSRSYPVRRPHRGGWSQDHLQRAAENTWQHNAKEVARQVDRRAVSIGAEMIIVAGDVRAAQLLVDELPERWRDSVIQTEAGSRAPGADLSHVEQVSRQAIADFVARRKSGVIDRFRQGNGESAALGPGAAVAAFDRHQVDTLLLDADNIAKTELWIGSDPSQLAMNEEELQLLAAGEPQRVHAEDALIRAAAYTDAELVLVSPDDVRLDHGVGAVLRYVDEATVRG